MLACPLEVPPDSRLGTSQTLSYVPGVTNHAVPVTRSLTLAVKVGHSATQLCVPKNVHAFPLRGALIVNSISPAGS